jgi:hypothetical protein
MLQLRGFSGTRDKVRELELLVGSAGTVRRSAVKRDQALISTSEIPRAALSPRCALQVKLVEFHPVQPWIAFADKADNVRVWDWTTQQVRNLV